MVSKYKEILNTDDKVIATAESGRVNDRAIPVNDEEYDGQPCSFTMKAAPALSIFKFVAYTAKERSRSKTAKQKRKRSVWHRKPGSVQKRLKQKPKS